ncbi:cationic amino acid transporter 4-like [Pomacea canaliculata]|uniref:cationic amino acid transporter 4-like n=1 Tax=Pomacea canaliculata TaxID=400727 RepID=UPI000D7360A1|nr:cationic amino acid transporter 4-like [Pomacea canaliculata]
MAPRDTWRYLWHRMRRRKLLNEMETHTSLHRCLSTLQLTAMGVGSTVGVGIYVLLGVVIRDYAGPGVIFSFLLAGVITLLIAFVFAEFGSYIPHTGGCYTYVYFAVGELPAFLTGWLQLITYTSSGAIGARAWSGLVDSLFNNTIQTFLDDRVGRLNLGPPFSNSLDWMAMISVLVIALVVSCNVHCSSIINSALAVLTMGILIFVTVAGVILGDVTNIINADQGGFLPYGIQGVIIGASSCFYATSGCDSICLAAEESKDPSKSVPRAILLTIGTVTIVYCGAAMGTLFLIPYSIIDLRAPIPSAFAYQGVTWARYLATIGPIFAVTNLNILSMFSVSRIAYRMASDGMFFKTFAYIHPRTKIPLVGVLVFGVLYAVAAFLLDLKGLVQFTVLCMLSQSIVLFPALIVLRAKGHNEETAKRLSSAEEEQSAGPERHSENESSNQLSDEETLLYQYDGEIRNNFSSESSRTKALGDSDGDLGSGTLMQGLRAADTDCEELLGLRAQQFVQRASNENEPSFEGAFCSMPTNTRPDRNQDFRDKHDKTPGKPQSQRQLRAEKKEKGKNQQSQSSSILHHFSILLNTKLATSLLVVCVAVLAIQFGLGWEELKSGNWMAFLATSLLICLIIFFCEVLHSRCGPVLHGGFQVPLVPYIPTLSCF